MSGTRAGDSRAGGAAATAALTVLTVVTAVGLGRLFEGNSYLVPVLVAAVAAHALAWGLRRIRCPAFLGAPASALGILLVALWVVFPGATAWGIPDGQTWNAVTSALAQARIDFQAVSAPAPATPGFLWLAMVGIGGAAALADSAAFRVGTVIEGVLPSFAVFIFTAGLGVAAGRSVAVAVWIAAVLAFLLLVEVEDRASSLAWFGTRRRGPGGTRAGGRALLLSVGAGLSMVAVVGGVLVGPALPGAGATPLVNWHNGGLGGSERTAISPLVNIRAELLQPSKVEVFTVSSAVRSYWRLTALDTFNGEVWSANDSYRRASPTLPSDGGGPGAGTTFDQTYTITRLSSVWLPAAFRPVQVTGVPGVSYNAESASLIAPSTTTNGLTYTVSSKVPDLTARELDQARVDPHAPTLARYLSLPANLPSSIAALARQVVKGEATPYGKALALQEFFRRNFTYSLDVAPSDANDALVQFLFHTKKGYCQQFAGAYAVMARAVGLPSRVAVGFTPGQLESDGLYHVRALNAHAWPEVELGDFGWVPFEPTPGRGEPGTSAYTGLAPAQAGPADVRSSSGPATTAPVTTAPPHPHAFQNPRPGSAGARIRNEGHQGAGASAHWTTAAGILGWVLLGLLALAALVLALVPAVAAVRRRRRRARARAGPEHVLVAFAEATEALARSGRPRHPAETFSHYARRMAPVLAPEAGLALVTLAEDAQEAAFAGRAGSSGAGGAAASRGDSSGAGGAVP
ncbi:MAG: transglutaminaseTgpA domain-containing protein, partial [Acidimicrobiales bacterium]